MKKYVIIGKKNEKILGTFKVPAIRGLKNIKAKELGYDLRKVKIVYIPSSVKNEDIETYLRS